jgi:hypothetical protein
MKGFFKPSISKSRRSLLRSQKAISERSSRVHDKEYRTLDLDLERALSQFNYKTDVKFDKEVKLDKKMKRKLRRKRRKRDERCDNIYYPRYSK